MTIIDEACYERGCACHDSRFDGKGVEVVAKQEQDEPVAWRTFDGEGGYDYRTYDMNENYANEWNERNPKHNGWVEPLYTTPPQRTWVGLTNEQFLEACKIAEGGNYMVAFQRIQQWLMENNI